jgi:hypothetical protein
VVPALPSCCRLATAKPCSSISTRSQPESLPEHTPFSSLIGLAGMADPEQRLTRVAAAVHLLPCFWTDHCWKIPV